MYAVVESGAKQYRISKGDIFTVEKLNVKAGAEVKLNKVMLVKDGNSFHFGSPYLKGAHVVCEAVGLTKADKVIAFKYKKRKSEKKKIGHRQKLLKLKVKEIETGKG